MLIEFGDGWTQYDGLWTEVPGFDAYATELGMLGDGNTATGNDKRDRLMRRIVGAM